MLLLSAVRVSEAAGTMAKRPTVRPEPSHPTAHAEHGAARLRGR